MTVFFGELEGKNRLMMEVELQPVQGTTFQTTGFPNLGPANYVLPDGTEMLLVESAQSMANRLEAVCWDETEKDFPPEIQGLPYVVVKSKKNGEMLTNSILESHRLNSPYILESSDTSFLDKLKEETGSLEFGAVDIRKLSRVVFKYDPNALLHGIFLSKKDLAGGRLRLQRLLSAFIEARNVRPVESGGVKMDRVNPKGDTRQGFGHVPFHRTEFSAEKITAYFNLDLNTLFSYDLTASGQDLLIGLSLWKIKRFLKTGLRLRTACDLDAVNEEVTRPENFTIPGEEEIGKAVKESIAKCREEGLFADPPVSVVYWEEKGKKKNGE